MKFGAAVISIAFVVSASQAQAQTAPISTTIPLTFTGTVTNTAADTIMARQPDGTLSHYTGPLPDLPYAKGDTVTISFNAILPTKAFYDSGLYQGRVAADGIYRIKLDSPYYTGGTTPGGVGNLTMGDVSGPINPADNFGQPTRTLLTVVYDYNNDTYSIEGSGNFLEGALGGPGLV